MTGDLPEDVLGQCATGEEDLVALLTVRFWATWKIQTAVALPVRVTSAGIKDRCPICRRPGRGSSRRCSQPPAQ